MISKQSQNNDLSYEIAYSEKNKVNHVITNVISNSFWKEVDNSTYKPSKRKHMAYNIYVNG